MPNLIDQASQAYLEGGMPGLEEFLASLSPVERASLRKSNADILANAAAIAMKTVIGDLKAGRCVYCRNSNQFIIQNGQEICSNCGQPRITP